MKRIEDENSIRLSNIECRRNFTQNSEKVSYQSKKAWKTSLKKINIDSSRNFRKEYIDNPKNIPMRCHVCCPCKPSQHLLALDILVLRKYYYCNPHCLCSYRLRLHRRTNHSDRFHHMHCCHLSTSGIHLCNRCQLCMETDKGCGLALLSVNISSFLSNFRKQRWN